MYYYGQFTDEKLRLRRLRQATQEISGKLRFKPVQSDYRAQNLGF